MFACETVIQTLCSAVVPDSTIMQLSGHKRVGGSLNHCSKDILEQPKLSTVYTSFEQLPHRIQSYFFIDLCNKSDNKTRLVSTQGILVTLLTSVFHSTHLDLQDI